VAKADLKARVVRGLPWGLLVCSALGVGYLYLQYFSPLASDHASLTVRWQEAEQNLTEARSQLEKATAKIGKLDKDYASLKADAQAAARPMDDTRADLDTVKAALEKSWPQALKSGAVALLDEGDRYGIRVKMRALFKTGTLKLTGRGRLRIKAIADALLRVPNQRYQIQGYVDAKPLITPAERKSYPTNWELSAAYAVTVLIHLNRDEQVPATQLSAAGFGDTRPSTAKVRGNARIEIVLLGRQPLGTTAVD
jgi:flagellar motor protein MotB